jgi:hypothetical protein
MSEMMRIKILFLLLSFYFCLPVPALNNRPYMPNPQLTPGHTINVTAADLCKPEYKNPARKIPIALKCQVFDRYRINGYEVGYNADRLIPISLGGSNSIDNLWPQPLSGEWCWHRKNELEHRLRKLVCRGDLDLKKAQQEIATDWISAYKKYVGEPRQIQSSQH